MINLLVLPNVENCVFYTECKRFNLTDKIKLIYDCNDLPYENILVEPVWTNTYHASNKEMVFGPDGLLTKTQLPEVIFERLRKKTCFLILPHVTEADHYHLDWIETMEMYFSSWDIPLTQIIYLSNAANGQEFYNKVCAKKSITPSINMEYYPFFHAFRWSLPKHQKTKQTDIEYQPGFKKKTFLCLNRRYKDHRCLMLLMLDKMNLLDHFYYSYPKIQPDHHTDGFNFLWCNADNYKGTIKISHEEVTKTYNKLPLVLDTNDFSTYPIQSSFVEIDHFFDNSLISIINETNWNNEVFHFTEKTFKAIVSMHPFILCSVPYSLRFLRSRGFQTFGNFWNENYDLELDHNRRLEMIVSLINNISRWSPKRKLDFSHAVKEVVEFNYNQFYDMNHNELYHLIEKYK